MSGYGHTEIKVFLYYGAIGTHYASFGSIAYFSAVVDAIDKIVGIRAGGFSVYETGEEDCPDSVRRISERASGFSASAV